MMHFWKHKVDTRLHASSVFGIEPPFLRQPHLFLLNQHKALRVLQLIKYHIIWQLHIALSNWCFTLSLALLLGRSHYLSGGTSKALPLYVFQCFLLNLHNEFGSLRVSRVSPFDALLYRFEYSPFLLFTLLYPAFVDLLIARHHFHSVFSRIVIA